MSALKILLNTFYYSNGTSLWKYILLESSVFAQTEDKDTKVNVEDVNHNIESIEN